MSPRRVLSIVIPAYEEALRIGPMLRTTLDYLHAQHRPAEVIVVDDGSRDRTSEIVSRLAEDADELRLIRLAKNQGKGYAVRTGIINARGDRILFMDADGATPIEELERLERALDAGAAIAIGSRAVRAPGVRVTARPLRRVIGRTFHALVRTLAVRGISDTQCGFKLFTATAAYDLFSRMRMNGFSFDVEVLLIARRLGYRIAEVPVNWVHRSGSRVRLVLDSLGMLRDLFAIRGHALRGDYEESHIAIVAPKRPRRTPAPSTAAGAAYVSSLGVTLPSAASSQASIER